MKYRWKLGCLVFSESIDWVLDELLKQKVELGIKDFYSMNEYYSVVVFNDDTCYKFRNSNKYYSWLCEGHFIKDNKFVYYYRNGRPSVKTMYMFMKLITSYKF